MEKLSSMQPVSGAENVVESWLQNSPKRGLMPMEKTWPPKAVYPLVATESDVLVIRITLLISARKMSKIQVHDMGG